MKKLTLEQDDTYTTANEATKPNYLIERERIEETPFTLVKQEEKYFLAIGGYKVSEDETDKETLLKQIEEKSWDLLIRTTYIMQKLISEIDNN